MVASKDSAGRRLQTGIGDRFGDVLDSFGPYRWIVVLLAVNGVSFAAGVVLDRVFGVHTLGGLFAAFALLIGGITLALGVIVFLYRQA
jgi:hypothetical protein